MKISGERFGYLLIKAFEIIDANGGQMSLKEFTDRMEGEVQFTPYEMALNPSGIIRWKKKVEYGTISLQKAKWIEARHGIWTLTPLGRKAMTLSPGDFFRESDRLYKEWEQSISRETK